MLTSKAIRQTFLDFFKEKGHDIVPSAPMVLKDDATLMFTNAGMNQFKDIFLGYKPAKNTRVADTQKCLRVSGKHNDLEEVGRDSYHQTMFEMLGNWSFGDYFKEEAIGWAWELLTERYGLDKDRLYVTIFGGDKNDGLEADMEAEGLWKKHIPADRILHFDRKDNFWEMGETGPCGPCSEIHIDLRDDKDRKEIDGGTLVNLDHPEVIEIWNLVFIQFNRKEDSTLEALPAKHIDTGMGFERLCMALQNKKTNYDTDVFRPYIDKIEKDSGVKYTGIYEESASSDIAMRVISDHVRAVTFAIADGTLPSNTGAGYVIRRILRRAIRYYYSFLNLKKPYIHSLIPLVADYFSDIFPEVKAQETLIKTVILEEEKSFLNTLEKGLNKINQLNPSNNELDGKVVFELYDTFGFPIDLTKLIAEEKNWTIDEVGFKKHLKEQKERSKSDAATSFGDWEELESFNGTEFIGYDESECDNVHVIRYRTVKGKKDAYQIVLDKTPFYAEGGGQVGDTGELKSDSETIHVINTYKENELMIHVVNKLPQNPKAAFKASIHVGKRKNTQRNHSATHLLHAALRQVLGTHVQQKGSLVQDKYLRFDFTHFSKMTEEELKKVETLVNQKILENIPKGEARNMPIEEAKSSGAMMLFGEKYGDEVRMITFDPAYSVELCGGCHVATTGEIGYFKLVSESAVAAGIRRIEARTGDGAIQYIEDHLTTLNSIQEIVKQQDVVKGITQLKTENDELKQKLEAMHAKMLEEFKKSCLQKVSTSDNVNVIAVDASEIDAGQLKNLAFQLEQACRPAAIILGHKQGPKAQLMMSITKEVSEEKNWHAGNIVRQAAKEINGGGGGQAFFATAGGSNPSGLEKALEIMKNEIALS